MKITPLLLIGIALFNAAAGATLGGRVELTPGEKWHEVKLDRVNPFPTVRFVPVDNRNAELLVTLIPMEITKVSDAASLRMFHRGLCAPMMTSLDQRLNVSELKLAQGSGVYTTFEDPDLVGKPVKRGSYKAATPVALWLPPDVVLQVTLFTDTVSGPDVEEGLKILTSAKLTGNPLPPRPVAPAGTPSGPVSIRGVDAALMLPAEFKPTGAARRDDPSYFSYVNEAYVNLSGWVDTASNYPGFAPFWAREKTALEKGMRLQITDEKISKVGGWDVAAYTTEISGVVQKHLRACRIEGKTWVDLHLSAVVVDGKSPDLEATLKQVGFKKF
jgi:hypothetical protein